MNCLIVFPDELVSDTQARLTGERAAYAFKVHGLSSGITVQAGQFGGKLGRARVKTASAEIIELELDLDIHPPPREPIDLIVAVPRPQTIKKVIGIATTMGIRSLHFVRSANTVKSYLQSPTLLPENIAFEVIKGLEQACDTRGPLVEVHAKFRDFVSYRLKDLLADAAAAFMLDTRAADQQSVGVLNTEAKKNIVGAIGPESGWADNEVEILLQHGFLPMSLGPRMLRVETAAAVFLGRAAVLGGRGTAE